MNIAFLIMAYRDPAQVSRLVRKLYFPGHFSVFIHVDKKYRHLPFKEELKEWSSEAHFIRKTITVYWGTYSMVQAVANSIDEILAHRINFDYIFLLSGQDYPVKTNRQILDFLSQNSGKEYINTYEIPTPGWHQGGWERIRKYHFLFIQNPILRRIFYLFNYILPERKFITGVKPYGGSTWWCISRSCAAYITRYLQDNKHMKQFYLFTRIPEEMVFHTIVMNSGFSSAVVHDTLRYVDWSAGGSHPKILVKDDFDAIVGSGKLFARKFDMQYSSEVLNMIDRHQQI